MNIRYWWERKKERNQWENQDRWMDNIKMSLGVRWDGVVWIGLIWFRIWTVGGLS
jgi:hypothetical protein